MVSLIGGVVLLASALLSVWNLARLQSAAAAPIVDKQGFMTLSTDAIVKHFAWDLPNAEAQVLAAARAPVHVSGPGVLQRR